MRVRAAHPSHFEWLRQHTGCLVTPDFRAVEAVDEDGRIKGMVGYCNWTPNSVQAHVAVDSPGSCRRLLVSAFAYPFIECNRGVMIGLISARNGRSARLATSLGFREVYRIRDGLAVGVDQILMELRREECRFIQHLIQRRAA